MSKQPYNNLYFLRCVAFAVLLCFLRHPSFSQKKNDTQSIEMEVRPLSKTNLEVGKDSCTLCLSRFVVFNSTNARIPKHAKMSLDTIIVLLNTHPCCNIKVGAFALQNCFPRGKRNKTVLFWDRVTSAIKYFVKNGISEDRIIFSYEGDNMNKLNTMNFEFTKEVKTLPPNAPAPNFRTYRQETTH